MPGAAATRRLMIRRGPALVAVPVVPGGWSSSATLVAVERISMRQRREWTPGTAAAADRMRELRACSLISVVPLSELRRRILLPRRTFARATSMMAFLMPGRGFSVGL